MSESAGHIVCSLCVRTQERSNREREVVRDGANRGCQESDSNLPPFSCNGLCHAKLRGFNGDTMSPEWVRAHVMVA